MKNIHRMQRLDDLKPCPSVAEAVLAAVDGSAWLRCNRLAGHEGNHIFHMEWGDSAGVNDPFPPEVYGIPAPTETQRDQP